MGFKSFRVQVILKLILITLILSGIVYLIFAGGQLFAAALLGLVLIGAVIDLIRYVEQTNRKLTRFLESIRYSDFATNFSTDNRLGSTFKGLNQSFNEVLEAFRAARADKEENLNYLNTVVQHIGTGLLSYDHDGRIELMNSSARRLMGVHRLNNIEKLKEHDEKLFEVITSVRPGRRTLYRKNNDVHLSISATDLKLRGKSLKLISLQNIRSELQQKEIESWQNLTRVLRHEIMNSMTPIASLTNTLNQIIGEDLRPVEEEYRLSTETREDLEDGLQTINNRSQALIRFVDAYRDYTNIPEPDMKLILVEDLLAHVLQLLKAETTKAGIIPECSVQQDKLQIFADPELLEMVLINLIKNAVEALHKVEQPCLEIKAFVDGEQQTHIQITDNGPGIVPEAIDRIFIPFYTTKKTGSGIGLALSRQIMQLHQGSLQVRSDPGEKTTFSMIF